MNPVFVFDAPVRRRDKPWLAWLPGTMTREEEKCKSYFEMAGIPQLAACHWDEKSKSLVGRPYHRQG
jgi:hypothetical protein